MFHRTQSTTDVLVGVKVEIGEPEPTRPDEGVIHFFVDWYVAVRCLKPTLFTGPNVITSAFVLCDSHPCP